MQQAMVAQMAAAAETGTALPASLRRRWMESASEPRPPPRPPPESSKTQVPPPHPGRPTPNPQPPAAHGAAKRPEEAGDLRYPSVSVGTRAAKYPLPPGEGPERRVRAPGPGVRSAVPTPPVARLDQFCRLVHNQEVSGRRTVDSARNDHLLSCLPNRTGKRREPERTRSPVSIAIPLDWDRQSQRDPRAAAAG